MGKTRPQAQITRTLLGAIDALERRGHPVKGVHISVDGGMTVLTETPPEALASLVSNDVGDWVALAGKTAIPRA